MNMVNHIERAAEEQLQIWSNLGSIPEGGEKTEVVFLKGSTLCVATLHVRAEDVQALKHGPKIQMDISK